MSLRPRRGTNFQPEQITRQITSEKEMKEYLLQQRQKDRRKKDVESWKDWSFGCCF